MDGLAQRSSVWVLGAALSGAWGLCGASVPDGHSTSLSAKGGPRPLRAREGEERFGLPGLTEAEAQEADNDSVLWLRTLQLMTVALDETADCAIGLEQPEDPAQWKEDDVNLAWRLGLSKLHGLAGNGGLRTTLWIGVRALRPEGVGPQEEETYNDVDQSTPGKEVNYTRSTMATNVARTNGRICRTSRVGTGPATGSTTCGSASS